MIERGEVMRKAMNIINGERKSSYGNPENCFDKIATYWTEYLGRVVESSDVAMMMVLLKIARESMNHKEDNIIDACGYLGLYEDFCDEI